MLHLYYIAGLPVVCFFTSYIRHAFIEKSLYTTLKCVKNDLLVAVKYVKIFSNLTLFIRTIKLISKSKLGIKSIATLSMFFSYFGILLFLILYRQSWFFGLWILVLCSVLISISYIDMQHLMIPDILTICLFLLGILKNLYFYKKINLTHYSYISIFGLSLLILCTLYRYIVGSEFLGIGDIKLICVMSTFFRDINYVWYIIMLSSVAGGIFWVLSYIISKFFIKEEKKICFQDCIPWAPSICVCFFGMLLVF